MLRLVRYTLLTIAVVGLATPSEAQNDARTSSARSCAAAAAGSYGYQCHGSASPGGALEPVTFIGTVTGTADGFFEGYGTFNSSGGSVSIRVAGKAAFARNCFGHIDYTTHELLLPGGGTVPLPPISFDFISVDGGNEALGTGVAPGGVIGDDVPRVTCRLVRIRR